MVICPPSVRCRVPTSFDRYARISTLYDLLDLPFEYGRYRRIRPLLFEGLSGRLLDAGVGTGRNFPYYPEGSTVLGIDLSPAMLARAERRLNRCRASIELRKMDVAVLDLADRSFDAAVASFLFCVVPDHRQILALRELGRVVKAGGVIRLLDYVRPRGAVRGALASLWEPWIDWAFGASFDRRTEEYIPKAGLQIVDSRFVVPDLIKLVSARIAEL
jgi:ubiquinone/menaquinone biosynthesis C-methylase UbiE